MNQCLRHLKFAVLLLLRYNGLVSASEVTNRSLLQVNIDIFKDGNEDREILKGDLFVKDILEYPYMVFLHHTNFYCSAVIISQRYILTAAHCVAQRDCSKAKKKPRKVRGELPIDDDYCKVTYLSKNQFTVFVGSTIPFYALTKSKLVDIYIHPDYEIYDESVKCFNRYDVAILKLQSKLIFGEKISRVNLDTGNGRFQTYKMCTLLGWGKGLKRDHASSFKRRLNYAKVSVIPWSECGPHKCSNTQLCTDNLENSIRLCESDSGGALICHQKLYGLSTGGKCYDGQNTYTKITSVIEWIGFVLTESSK